MGISGVVTGILIFSGCFLLVVASIGLIRFPDFYTRIHPAGKADTLGQAMTLIGLIVYDGFTLVSLKLLIIVIFVFIANPTATHALANAAFKEGIEPWKKGDERK